MGSHTLEIPYEIPYPGDFRIELTLGGDSLYRLQLAATVSHLHETRFGAMLPSATDDATLWWAPSAWKISRHRQPPQGKKDTAIRINAAANEREAAQFVIRSEQPIRGLTIERDALVHRESGAVLPHENIEVFRVEYVPVEHPTDDLGARGLWPDPLPPLGEPLDRLPQPALSRTARSQAGRVVADDREGTGQDCGGDEAGEAASAGPGQDWNPRGESAGAVQSGQAFPTHHRRRRIRL